MWLESNGRTVPYTAANWRDGAVCAQLDPEIFYPEKGGSSRRAKAICLSCPVREFCLGDALKYREEFGIWGGTAWRARRKALKTATSSDKGASRHDGT